MSVTVIENITLASKYMKLFQVRFFAFRDFIKSEHGSWSKVHSIDNVTWCMLCFSPKELWKLFCVNRDNTIGFFRLTSPFCWAVFWVEKSWLIPWVLQNSPYIFRIFKIFPMIRPQSDYFGNVMSFSFCNFKDRFLEVSNVSDLSLRKEIQMKHE